MGRAILLSIQPKWCEVIASGKKTVEVRKTKPKIDVPFKCYIYETQGRTETPFVDEEGHHIFKGRGQVIGEFVCDKIDTVMSVNTPCMVYFTVNDKMDMLFSDISCLDVDELGAYIGFNKDGYGWHIADLKIYDNPRELREFIKQCPYNGNCQQCEFYSDYSGECRNIVTRPPQSWMYVEALE